MPFLTAYTAPIRCTAAIVVLSLLSGCATLPSSGPTGGQIVESAQKKPEQFKLVSLDAMQDLPSPAANSSVPQLPFNDETSSPSDLIGIGDVLSINIYEAGVSLFATPSSGLSSNPSNGEAHDEKLPLLRVDDQGEITIPFVGQVQAAGKTAQQLQQDIAKKLADKSQMPQVLVTITDPLSRSVIVNGEVQKPGRFTLTVRHETLNDIIALAGGYRGEVTDLMVRLERYGKVYTDRLNDIVSASHGDTHLLPGDRLTLLRDPRTFTVFGGFSKVNQFPFNAPNLSLAEAIARAGGSSATAGDPKAVFVFRFPQGEGTPVIYHLNMMHPQSYFLAQKFAMHDKDLLYLGNAQANQPSKLIQIISQLFTPALLARQLFP